jgi:hypothetical protein
MNPSDLSSSGPDVQTATIPALRETRSAESRTFQMTEHATRRMYARAMNYDMIQAALQWGTVVHARGAAHFVVRDKDVAHREELEEKHRGAGWWSTQAPGP